MILQLKKSKASLLPAVGNHQNLSLPIEFCRDRRLSWSALSRCSSWTIPYGSTICCSRVHSLLLIDYWGSRIMMVLEGRRSALPYSAGLFFARRSCPCARCRGRFQPVVIHMLEGTTPVQLTVHNVGSHILSGSGKYSFLHLIYLAKPQAKRNHPSRYFPRLA